MLPRPIFIASVVLLIVSTVQAQEKIKIGVAVPLSGTAAAYGTDIRNALEFANEKLFHSTYQLIVEDDKCLDKDAVSIAHKFINVDKVRYALGFGCSGTVLAAAPVYESGKVVVIASGTGAPAITYAGDYIFRTKPNLNLAAELLAKEFAARFKKVAAVSEETAYCQGLTDATRKAAQELNVEFLNENFLPGNEDFRATLLRLRSKGVEAIFLNTQGEPGMVTLFKQFHDLKWPIPVYGTFTPGSPSFIQSVGADANGIIYADLQFNRLMLNAAGQNLYAEFEKRYGPAKSAEHYSALSLVAFSALNEAIKSGKDVKQYLYENTFHDLVDGYSFDKNGDVVSEKLGYVLKMIQDGVPVPYERK